MLVVTTEWPSPEYPVSGIFVSRQVEALRKEGLDVRVFAFRGKARLGRYARAALQIRHLCREWAPDVVHAHFGQAGLVSTVQRRVPVVVTFHGTDLLGMPWNTLRTWTKSRLHRLAGKIAARRAAEIIVVSSELASLIKRRRCRVIPMSIDTNTFQPFPKDKARCELAWPDTAQVVLFVGDPANNIKNFPMAERVVEMASGDLPRLILKVCWNLPSNIVSLHMNAADVLLITSLHEGGPLIAREALACGLPVVSVKVGDVERRLAGVAGCRVCEREVPALVAAVKRALEHRNDAPASRLQETESEQLLTASVIRVYDDVKRRPSII